MAEKDNYIGLMSGTSMDGVDGVIVDNSCKNIIASIYIPYPKTLKEKLRKIIITQQISLENFAKLDIDIANIFCQTVQKLLKKAKLLPKDIRAIGSHGQTIYHQGGKYSWQIGHGAIIQEKTSIDTIADFRMSDVASGGQGAPLTPKYHQYLLDDKDGVIINLGGIANITIIQNGKISGFDTGPANTLLDNWIAKNKDLEYDKNGTWAQSGCVDKDLLAKMLSDNYFSKKAPKSTGLEYFNLSWLSNFLTSQAPVDIQRTLVELSIVSIADNIPDEIDVYLCGGGANNIFFTQQLAKAKPNNKISTTMDLNIHPDYLEAAAFAYFAKLNLEKKSANLPNITGAKQEKILGTIYAN